MSSSISNGKLDCLSVLRELQVFYCGMLPLRRILFTCQQIKISWMIFGNNKELFFRPGSVRDRFPHPAKGVPENAFVKAYIVGGLGIRFPGMHSAVGRMYGCMSDFFKVTNHAIWLWPVYKYVYIRHYQTRSEQEFCLKMLRWKGHAQHGNSYQWKRYDTVNVYEPNQPYSGQIGDDCNITDNIPYR